MKTESKDLPAYWQIAIFLTFIAGGVVAYMTNNLMLAMIPVAIGCVAGWIKGMTISK